jgi:hypothetical protein
MSQVADSSIDAIFKAFVREFQRHFIDVYIVVPTEAILEKVLAPYRNMSPPGAVSSIDCTHIKWDICPVYLSNLCKGNERYPTLCFEVSVDSTRYIHHCNRSFIDTTTDITTSRNDVYVLGLFKGL